MTDLPEMPTPMTDELIRRMEIDGRSIWDALKEFQFFARLIERKLTLAESEGQAPSGETKAAGQVSTEGIRVGTESNVGPAPAAPMLPEYPTTYNGNNDPDHPVVTQGDYDLLRTAAELLAKDAARLADAAYETFVALGHDEYGNLSCEHCGALYTPTPTFGWQQLVHNDGCVINIAKKYTTLDAAIAQQEGK